MNINFQTVAGQKKSVEPFAYGMDADSRVNKGTSKTGSAQADSLSVDLGASLFSSEAYAQNSMDLDDISRMAQDKDVWTQHNYMALLSNTMSEEDFAKAAEDGFDLKNLNSSDSVTILDKIKSALLAAGVEITGYNDDLSVEKLTKITGSAAFANSLKKSFSENDIPLTNENVRSAQNAYDQISQVTELDDSAVKFMVQNGLEPTIKNLYLAAHSTNGQNASGRGFYAQETGGYYAQKADTYNWEQLEPQIEKVITEAGENPKDGKLVDEAKWMIAQGIPLTAENLLTLTKIRNTELPASAETVADAAAAAISNGRPATEGNLLDVENNVAKAERILKETGSISDDAITKVVTTGQELNIKNLVAVDKADSVALQSQDERADQKMIQARLQLEEVRLMMTFEANKQLLDSGFSIDTAPMEQLIEKLKGVLGDMASESAGEAVDEITKVTTANSSMIFKMTLSRVSVIKYGPVDVVGAMSEELESASLMQISAKSEKMARQFKAADEGYEKLMTAPRQDLGDSIKKAFRNVDDILDDLGEEKNEVNQRAIRILGYNRMEINEENFEKVRAWEEKLRSTMDRLKPGAVLDLIRAGKNPLGMTIDELSQNLDQGLFGGNNDERKESGEDRSQEKYSKFLYKLERKGNITEKEKASFIGIYRLFHTLKANDYQAIGSLLTTGQDMTLENLLGATRTKKASLRGLDYQVDDNFGGVEAGKTNGLKIDEQINFAFRFYSAQADIVYENLEPEKLLAAKPNGKTLLPELAQDLANAQTDHDLDREYYNEQVARIREVTNSKATDGALTEMTSMAMEVTFNNLEAMIANRRSRRSVGIWEETIDALGKEGIESQEALVDSLVEDDYPESYRKELESVSDRLSDVLMNPDNSYIDVRAISLMQKQLTIMSQASEKGSFEIPVEVDGTRISMHVTLKSDSSNISRMEASILTFEFGLITANLYEEEGQIKGTVSTTNGQNPDETEYLESLRTKLCERLADSIKGIGIDQDNIALLYHAQTTPQGVGTGDAIATDGTQNTQTETGILLKMAKAFIESL